MYIHTKYGTSTINNIGDLLWVHKQYLVKTILSVILLRILHSQVYFYFSPKMQVIFSELTDNLIIIASCMSKKPNFEKKYVQICSLYQVCVYNIFILFKLLPC